MSAKMNRLLAIVFGCVFFIPFLLLAPTPWGGDTVGLVAVVVLADVVALLPIFSMD